MTELSKPTRPKAIAVSKLIGGKLVTELAAAKQAELARTRALCAELCTIPAWAASASDAALKLDELIAVVKG